MFLHRRSMTVFFELVEVLRARSPPEKARRLDTMHLSEGPEGPHAARETLKVPIRLDHLMPQPKPRISLTTASAE